MSIDEMVATAPARVLEGIITKHGIQDNISTTLEVSETLHEIAHNDAMTKMTHKRSTLFGAALENDGKLPSDTKYRDAEIKKGINYAEDMGTAYYDTVNKTKSIGSRTQDSREFEKHTIKYSKIYNTLSNTARLAATYHFMQGFPVERLVSNALKLARSSSFPTTLPATNKNSWAETTLEPTFIREFMREYNKSVDLNRYKRNQHKPRRLEYPSLYQIDKGC